jgi:hypothetical protein
MCFCHPPWRIALWCNLDSNRLDACLEKSVSEKFVKKKFLAGGDKNVGDTENFN